MTRSSWQGETLLWQLMECEGEINIHDARVTLKLSIFWFSGGIIINLFHIIYVYVQYINSGEITRHFYFITYLLVTEGALKVDKKKLIKEPEVCLKQWFKDTKNKSSKETKSQGFNTEDCQY